MAVESTTDSRTDAAKTAAAPAGTGAAPAHNETPEEQGGDGLRVEIEGGLPPLDRVPDT